MKRLKRIQRTPPTLTCPLCGTSFTPPLAANYEYNKYRKYCSEQCRHRATYEKRLRTLAAKKQKSEPVKVELKKVEPCNKVNLYRHVNRMACAFAGLSPREFVSDE